MAYRFREQKRGLDLAEWKATEYWRDSEPGDNDQRAEIFKNGGLFNGISRDDEKNAYICEMPGGKITFHS